MSERPLLLKITYSNVKGVKTDKVIIVPCEQLLKAEKSIQVKNKIIFVL